MAKRFVLRIIYFNSANGYNIVKMKKLLLTFLMLSAVFSARAQKLAVNTDVLMDACMIPSVGLEMTVGNWSTLGLNVLGCNKPYGKNIKLLAAQPEYRYYFSGRPMHSLFVGVGGVGAIYDASIKGKVYKGIAYGGGITFGYVMNVTKRLFIDFHAGVAAVGYNRKEYFAGDNYGDYVVGGLNRPNASGYYLMPQRIGISVAYILK